MAEFIYQMHQVRKAHGDKVILDDVTMGFFPGAKIGVVGPNGMGKSTLLKIMAGKEEISNGEARLAPGYSVRLLEQEPELDDTKTVKENIEMAFGEVIAKVNRDEFEFIAEKLGLESLISAKNVSSNLLSRYARALENSLGSNVETLYKLMDGKAEALEFRVQPDFKMTGVPLKEMQLKPGILISGILRGRKALIPAGDDEIQVGDRVVVMATGHRINDLSDILQD
jgi:ATPase subunit of ABC transporter with duplicated ATPase domains